MGYSKSLFRNGMMRKPRKKFLLKKVTQNKIG